MFGWLRAAFSRTSEAMRDIAQSLVPSHMAKAVWTATASVIRYLHLAHTAYGLNSVVYACIRMLATSVPEAPLVAYKRLKDGEREPLGWDHPLQQLIRQPNELMTEYELIELIETHMDIGGRAFVWKQRMNNGQPMALWPMRPDRVGPIYSTSDVEGERVLAGWSYALPGSGEKIAIPRSEVIAFAFPDPGGETGGIVEGIGPTQVLAREISADNEATSFVGSLLANYAQPSMVIKTSVPVNDKETARKLKANFMREFGGPHRGEPALLDSNTTVEKLSFSMRDMEFKGVRANAESRMCAVYGVPPILVGVQVGLEHATYSNMAQARAYFAQTTLRNRWRRYGDQFTNDLAHEFDDDLLLDFDESKVAALAESRMMAVQPFAAAFAAGAVTINEYRQRVLNLPEMNGGDVLVLPFNRSTIGSDGEGEPVPTAKSLPVKHKVLPGPHSATKAEEPEPIPDDIKPAIETRERHSDALELKLTDALQRLGETVAARLIAESKALPDPDTLYSDDDNEEIERAITEAAKQIMPDAVADAAKLLGIEMSFNIEWSDIDDALTESGKRIKGISETTRAQIVSVVKQSLELGEHPFEAAERLRESFGFSKARARTIARTEMAHAYASATVAAYEDAGVEKVHVWDGTDFDEPCKRVHNTTQTLAWYRSNPTQHPQCTRAASAERNL